MTRSFTDSGTSVQLASPLTSWLPTKTIAARGATPSRIMPAMHSLAEASSTHSL